MGSIDFGSEPAYWYEKTIRDSERNHLPVRSRPAINRDEKLIAGEVRRHLDRQTFAKATRPTPDAEPTYAPRVGANVQFCATCGLPFTKRAWTARKVWKVIYPRAGGRIEIYRHGVCPNVKG